MRTHRWLEKRSRNKQRRRRWSRTTLRISKARSGISAARAPILVEQHDRHPDDSALSVPVNSPSLTPRVKAAIRRFDQQATIEWCLADPTFDEFGVEPEDLGRRVEHYRQERNFTVDFAEWLDETRRELSEAAKAALNEPAEADLNDRERCRGPSTSAGVRQFHPARDPRPKGDAGRRSVST